MDQVRTEVIDDVGELSEMDLRSHGRPKPEELTNEMEELLERQSENSESDVPETIYGSPEAVRYFQKVAIPPRGTESTVIRVEDLSARSKLVVRPLSLPDTYVDRHGSPGTKHHRTDFVVELSPEPESEIQRQSAPLPIVHFHMGSIPALETLSKSEVASEERSDVSTVVPETQLQLEPGLIAESGLELGEKGEGIPQQEQVHQSDIEAGDSRVVEPELMAEAKMMVEQVMKSAIEQVMGRPESSDQKTISLREIEQDTESRLAEEQSDMETLQVAQLVYEANPEFLESDSVGLECESQSASDAESDIISESESNESIAMHPNNCDLVLVMKPESDPEMAAQSYEINSVPVLELATSSNAQLVLEKASELVEANADALLELNSESDSSSEADAVFIPRSNSMLESVPVQEDRSGSILEIDPQSDLEPVVETIRPLEFSSDVVLHKLPEAVLEEVSLLESVTESVMESDVELVVQTSTTVQVRKSEVQSVFEAELVLETEPVVYAQLEESPELVRTASDEGVDEDDMDELYTEEEDFENKAHAARVASVLNDLHRRTPDESPLDERAERMAEAILASAMFETIFLQPDNQSEATPVSALSLPATDLPFIGSSFCRIQFPSTGTSAESETSVYLLFSFI